MEHDTTPTADQAAALAPFADARQVLLATYRKDGTPVGTPVHIAVDGPQAYVRTYDPSGKLKRLRRTEAKYPVLHGRLIPWAHRRKGVATTQIELTPE